MGLCVKTTVEIEDHLLKRSKTHALNEGVSLRALIEEGLRQVLARQGDQVKTRGGKRTLPVCSQGGGVRAGVNLNDSSELEDRMSL